jgi:polysaccharide pyruvyl transferase WcaK-like protein
MKVREDRRKKIALFGHFDSSNFGNESTLQAMLYHLRRFRPDAEVTCISTGSKATAATHHINAIPIADVLFDSWIPQNRVSRAFRRICVGLPSELYRWIRCFMTLRRTDVLIVPGTGLLTDAYGVLNWGPYNLFKWSLMARVCGCKLRFVSIGAGPIYGTLGKYCIKSMLSCADFRSYRDNSSKRYLKEIGFRTDGDREYPDLVFSLPEAVIPRRDAKSDRRSIIGVGVMAYAGKYSTSGNEAHRAYLESLVEFVRWLLDHDYDVRLLIGDVADRRVTQELRSLLKDRLSLHGSDEARIVDEPVNSVEDLLSQIAATEIVVATRFHNTLFAMLCDKPVIAISFHHKCDSLMSAMGLSDYCLDINGLKSDRLIEKFCNLKANANKISLLIREKQRKFREELDEQYKLIFSDM